MADDALLADATVHLREALSHARVSREALERLAHPKAALKVSIPVRLDDGRLETFRGYRVRYDDSRGPTRVASATTRASTSTRCRRWRSG